MHNILTTKTLKEEWFFTNYIAWSIFPIDDGKELFIIFRPMRPVTVQTRQLIVFKPAQRSDLTCDVVPDLILEIAV